MHIFYRYSMIHEAKIMEPSRPILKMIRNSQILCYFICSVWVSWHINPCRLFNAKSYVYIYIKYIWFGLVGISTLVGYLMSNPIYTYIIKNMIWFSWLINPCRLFHVKSYLYIYIKYIWFGLVGLSTLVGYLMPNPIYTYILNIYDLVWLAYQPL